MTSILNYDLECWSSFMLITDIYSSRKDTVGLCFPALLRPGMDMVFALVNEI